MKQAISNNGRVSSSLIEAARQRVNAAEAERIAAFQEYNPRQDELRNLKIDIANATETATVETIAAMLLKEPALRRRVSEANDAHIRKRDRVRNLKAEIPRLEEQARFLQQRLAQEANTRHSIIQKQQAADAAIKRAQLQHRQADEELAAYEMSLAVMRAEIARITGAEVEQLGAASVTASASLVTPAAVAL